MSICALVRSKEENRLRPKWEEVSPGSFASNAMWAQWDLLQDENRLAKRARKSVNGRHINMQCVRVLEEVHGGKAGAHLGLNKTLAKAREYGCIVDRIWKSGAESVQYVPLQEALQHGRTCMK